MKFTRKQQLAYDTGRLLKAEPLNEMIALNSRILEEQRTCTNKEGLKIWRSRLVWKTEEVFRRQLHLIDYKRAVQLKDKNEIRRTRVTSFDIKTKDLIRSMMESYDMYQLYRRICEAKP